MAHEVNCPNGHKLQVKPEHFGLQVRCPICQAVMVVPDLSAGAPDSPSNQLPLTRGTAQSQESTGGGMKPIGYILLVLGLVAVLAARGMDNLAARQVARAQAKVNAAEADFNDNWEKKLEDAKSEERSARMEERNKERERLEKGDWRDLKVAARNVKTHNDLNGYWFEMAFVIGAVLLALGLLIVGTQGVGAERVICLVMLAIITFSLFIGGFAWLAAIKGMT